MTLNKDINGVGGILTNYEFSNRGLGTTTNGFVALGARGGTIAATTGNLMGISEDIRGVGSLTIGTTDIIDGLPKLGTVELNAVNTYTGGTIVNAGTLKTLNASALGSTSGQLTVNTGGTLEMNNNSLTVGNLTGTGGEISGGVSGTRTLTIGQGDTGGGNYQGSIQNGAGGTTAITKTGTGTITLSGTNSYTGKTIVNGGTLELGVDDCLANSSNVEIGAGNLKAAAGVDDTVGTLDPTAAATINLGSGATLAFAASNGVDWTGGTLNITGTLNFAGGIGSSLRFGTTNGGLTAGQLLQISATGWTGFGLDAEGYLTATSTGGNIAPTISDIANPPSFPSGGNTGALAFTVTDEDAASVVPSGSSSNTTLVPNGNIVFGGSGASRTVTVTPVSGLSGSATITVTLTDNGSPHRPGHLHGHRHRQLPVLGHRQRCDRRRQRRLGQRWREEPRGIRPRQRR